MEVLKDERLVIIVEQKPDATEDECFKWMSSVIQVSLLMEPVFYAFLAAESTFLFYDILKFMLN